MPENINLFTHLRLDEFVKNFKDWYNCPNNPINPDSDFVGNNYDYMSFIPSPDAIHLVDIGRIPLDDVSNNFIPTSSTNSVGNTVNTNTPLGWKTQLGTIYSDIKQLEYQKIKNGEYRIKPGLYGQIINLPIKDVSNVTFSDLGINQKNFLNYVDASGSSWVNLFPQSYESSNYNGTSYNGTFSSLNYDDLKQTSTIDKTWLDTSFIGIEYFGYFKPSSVGNYSFSMDAGTDFCLMWLGNKAVCEYVTSNADIVTSNSPFKQTFLEDSYMPIRIQYFASKQRLDAKTVNVNQRKFSITVTNMDTNEVIDDNSTCFSTISNVDGSIYFPKFIYCAFASSTISDFQQGKFICYSFGGPDVNYDDFFSYMKSNKKSIFGGVNDAIITDGISVSEYGTLPNGINYTDAYNARTVYPSKLSIYRIYSDIRMGRSFQINKKTSGGKYVMREVSNNILTLTEQYTEFPDYYPSNDLVNALKPTPIKKQSECLNKCNTEGTNCSYYYTYGVSGEQFCVTGTKYSTPLFNQIAGPNQTNGSLFLRGYKTAKPTIKECIAGKVGDKNFSSVTNTIDYTASNPYYNYTIAGDIITDLSNIGDCANPSLTNAMLKYTSMEKEASDILYKTAQYQSDGRYDINSSNNFSKPDYSTLSADCKYTPISFQPAPAAESNIDGFQSEITDATMDTESNIRKLNSVQQSVQQKENQIDYNKKKLSDEIIPKFNQTRDVLKNDNKYDYNGDVLMYLRDTKIPSRDEQRLIDSSDERFKQGSMYSLGIITAATLIILAIYLGKD